MDPQDLNYFTNLTADVLAYIEAWQKLEDRFQEAFDRDIDARLGTLNFAEAGDMSYLDEAKLNAAFAAFTALSGTMNAAARLNWARLYGVIR
jgi:hypothetical protein